MKRTILLVALLMFAINVEAFAEIREEMSYQGVLMQADGNLVANGNYEITFSIYSLVGINWVQQWTETLNSVEVENGRFEEILGRQVPLTDVFNIAPPHLLGIQIGNDPELLPRIQLTASPYAFRAAVADSAVVCADGGGDSGWTVVGDEMYSVVTGHIGIGTQDPGSKLHVTDVSPVSVHDAQLRLDGSEETGEANTGGGITLGGHDGSVHRTWGTIRGLKENDTVGSTNGFLSLATRAAGGGGPYERMRVTSEGKVGIGTDDPLVLLHIEGEDNSLPQDILYKEKLTIEGDDSILGLYSDSNGSAGSGIMLGEVANGEMQNKWGIVRGTPGGGNMLRFTFGTDQGYWTQNPTIMCLDDEGNVGIGTTTPSRKLTVRGNILIQSESTGEDILELGEGLDYAEGFDISNLEKIDFGTVLTIDPENPGELTVSTEPYDFKVAGIVAGAQGLGSGVRLGAGQFDYDVALAGRVYCKVDATFGAVVPGDLLTTSPTEGYAMKATDRDRSQGAILGKAMQSLAEGEQGEILVLVTLQ